jgi:hypothetical protein
LEINPKHDFSAMFCDQKCFEESKKRFHQFECNMEAESLRKFFYSEPDGRVLDPLITLRKVTEPNCMAGSVERLRELMSSNDQEENLFDFDLSHEIDESFDIKHLRILSILQGIWTENEIEVQAREPSIQDAILEYIYRKIFPKESDFRFMKDFLIRFTSILSCNSISLNMQHKTTAAAILPFGSFIRHSCDPNVVFVTNFGNKVPLIVIKPVKKGEELFINLM